MPRCHLVEQPRPRGLIDWAHRTAPAGMAADMRGAAPGGAHCAVAYREGGLGLGPAPGIDIASARKPLD